MEMKPPAQFRTEKELRAFEDRVAFRETFLVEMPNSDKEAYRAFGRAIWRSGADTPIKRQGLKAVVADLEHVVEFIEIVFSVGSTGELAEERITRSALDGRAELRQAIDRFRAALGLKKRQDKPDSPTA